MRKKDFAEKSVQKSANGGKYGAVVGYVAVNEYKILLSNVYRNLYHRIGQLRH